MKFLSLLVLAMGLAFGLYACDNTDDDKKVGVEVLKAFEQRFPQAVQVDWDVDIVWQSSRMTFLLLRNYPLKVFL